MTFITTARLLGLGTSTLLVSSLACADEPFINPGWANSAWYLGAGVGRSLARADEDRVTRSLRAGGATGIVLSADDRATGYKLFLGRQLDRHFALEAGYLDLGSFGMQASTTPAGGLTSTVGYRGVDLGLLAKLPMSDRTSVYVRLGANYTLADASVAGQGPGALSAGSSSERKLNPKLGLGVEFNLSEALALRLEAERNRVEETFSHRSDVDLYSISLVYKFGRPVSSRSTAYSAPYTESAPLAPKQAPLPEAAPALAPPVPPVVAPPEPRSEKVTFSAKTLFDFDKSELKPEGKAALDTMLGQQKGVNVEVMLLVGHTDSVGTDAYNQALSLRRAAAVQLYLAQQGVQAERIFADGKGELQPLSDNKTAAGRANNRRVTVEVVGTRTVPN